MDAVKRLRQEVLLEVGSKGPEDGLHVHLSVVVAVISFVDIDDESLVGNKKSEALKIKKFTSCPAGCSGPNDDNNNNNNNNNNKETCPGREALIRPFCLKIKGSNRLLSRGSLKLHKMSLSFFKWIFLKVGSVCSVAL